MRISAANSAIQAIRKSERTRADLHKHLSEVRAGELEALATATDHGDVRFMQGRIAALAEIIKALE